MCSHHNFLRSGTVNLSPPTPPPPKDRKKLVTCTVQCVRTKKYHARNGVSNRRIDISVVDVAARQSELTIRSSISGSGTRFFSSSERHDGSGAHSASSSGYRRCLHGVKWLGSGADHSIPSNAEVKNEWNYISASVHTFVVRTAQLYCLSFSALPTSELRFSKRVVCVNFIYLRCILIALSGISDCLGSNGRLICE
jgi:hypothetical protein